MRDDELGNDKELESLLAGLRNEAPTELQVRKWKSAVQSELRLGREPRNLWWMQLAAASVVGFLVGAVITKSFLVNESPEKFAQVEEENATIEYVFTKTN